MFGTSGIRGPVGETVTADLATAVGAAVASEGATRVVLGRDARESGRLLADAAAAGARECGADVVDLGRVSTPTLARAVGWRDADAGVMVTASHNPAPDNGLKLWNPSGQAFDEAQREAVSERIRERAFDREPWDGVGDRTEWDGATDRHVEALVAAVDPDPLSVVVDLGNGVGRPTVEALQRLGCEVETLNAQPDGRFPGRPSEPTADNCGTLATVVAATDADLGIAHDGDADRMMAVTEDGEFVPGDLLLGLFGRAAVAAGDRVAAPVNTSLAVDDLLADREASVTRTRVGDVFVAERATEADVTFGGEPSGAWIWPEETLAPDGPLAACRLVELVSERGPLSELVAAVDAYPMRRESVETEAKAAVMERVRERVEAEYPDADTVDGVRVEVDGGWFLVRASGTQPLVRITAQARTEQRVSEVFDEASVVVTDSL